MREGKRGEGRGSAEIKARLLRSKLVHISWTDFSSHYFMDWACYSNWHITAGASGVCVCVSVCVCVWCVCVRVHVFLCTPMFVQLATGHTCLVSLVSYYAT